MQEGLASAKVRKRIWTAFTVSAVVSLAISVLAEVFVMPTSWMGATVINVVGGLIAWSYLIETLRPYSNELKIGYPSAYFFVGIGLLLRILGILVLAISLSIRIQNALSASAAREAREESDTGNVEVSSQSHSRKEPVVSELAGSEAGLVHTAIPAKSAPPLVGPARDLEQRSDAYQGATNVGRTTSGVAKIYSSTKLTIMSAFLLGVFSLGLVWVYGQFAIMINASREEGWNDRADEYESALARHESAVDSWQLGLVYATSDFEIATFLAAELSSKDAEALLEQVNRNSELIVPDEWRILSPEERAAREHPPQVGWAAIERIDIEAREKLAIANSEPYRSVMTDANKRRALRAVEARYREGNPHPTLEASPPASLSTVTVPSNEARLWICGIIVLALVCIGLTVQLAKGVKDG